MGGAEFDPHISAVSETLFLPLYALALESQRSHPIMVDERAVALTRRLNEHFAHSDKRIYRKLVAGRLPSSLLSSVTLRIRHYDQVVSAFLDRAPDGTIVNLGCGLDDRYHRVDNGLMRWFDLDLPPVIDLRRSLLPEAERQRYLASSVLDFGWMDQVAGESSTPILFVAEGLFMYLPAPDVRALVIRLNERFGGSELLAEVAHERIVRVMHGRWGRGKFRRQFGLSDNVVYGFGLSDSRDMESWAPGLELIDDWNYFDEDEPKIRWMRPFTRFELVRLAQWSVHYRLGGPSQTR